MSNPQNETLGHYLKRCRLMKLCLTQTDMANLIGISFDYYNQIENEKVIPAVTVIKKICIATNQSPEFINKLIRNQKGED